jgi:signal transduction histidine kinase
MSTATGPKVDSKTTAVILVSLALVLISLLAIFAAIIATNTKTIISGQAVEEKLGDYNVAFKVEIEGVTWHLILSDKALADHVALTESNMKNKKVVLRGYKGWRGQGTDRYFFVSEINP